MSNSRMIFAVHENDQIDYSVAVAAFVVVPKNRTRKLGPSYSQQIVRFYQEINLTKFGFKEIPASASKMLL